MSFVSLRFFRLWIVAAGSMVLGAACGESNEAPDGDAGIGDVAMFDTGAPGDDAGTGTDTGSSDSVTVPPSRRMSYVASGQTPMAATRVIVFGDSISAGVGASGGLDYSRLVAMNDDGVYPEAAAADLESLTGSAVERVSIAVSGATTHDLESQLRSLASSLDLPASGHTVVIGTIGGNDLARSIRGGDPMGVTLDQAVMNIRALVEFFQNAANFPDGTSIYVANVYDPSDGVGTHPMCFFGLELSAITDAMPLWSMRYVELGMELDFSVVDILGHFRGHGFYSMDPANEYYNEGDPTLWWAGGGDCLHPNDRGHHEMRRVFFEAMDPSYSAD